MEMIESIKKFGTAKKSESLLEVAEILESFKNPGSVNLIEALTEIVEVEPNP